MEEVTVTPGGENIRVCIQCGVCVGGCFSDAILDCIYKVKEEAKSGT